MPYNANIPQANDQLSVSQGQILANFMALAPLIPITTNGQISAIEGFNYILLQDQIAADPATTATENAIYQKGNNLFWRKNTSGTVVGITTATLTPHPGDTNLPSGALLKWDGTVNMNLSLTQPVLFVIPFPNFVGSVLLTANDANSGVIWVTNKTPNGFTINRTTNALGSSIQWFAVGG
jgi:hypothetical protein